MIESQNGLALCIALSGDLHRDVDHGIVLVRDYSKQEPIMHKFPGGQTEGRKTAYVIRHELADETGLEYDCGLRYNLIGATVADAGYAVTFYAVRFAKEYVARQLEDWGDEPMLQVRYVPLEELRRKALLLEQHKKWLARANPEWFRVLFPHEP